MSTYSLLYKLYYEYSVRYSAAGTAARDTLLSSNYLIGTGRTRVSPAHRVSLSDSTYGNAENCIGNPYRYRTPHVPRQG